MLHFNMRKWNKLYVRCKVIKYKILCVTGNSKAFSLIFIVDPSIITRLDTTDEILKIPQLFSVIKSKKETEHTRAKLFVLPV